MTDQPMSDAIREYDAMRLQQVCQALDEPFEIEEGHGPIRMDWPRILEIARGRTRAWSTLLRRVEEHDPEWLAEWRRQPSERDESKRWTWNPMSQSYGPPPGDS